MREVVFGFLLILYCDGYADVDECKNMTDTDCMWSCINIPGNYLCKCPNGYHGDGKKSGTGCNAKGFPAHVILGNFLVFYSTSGKKSSFFWWEGPCLACAFDDSKLSVVSTCISRQSVGAHAG